MAYSDKVIDHYENPRNVGSFDKGDDSVGTGMVGAPACGDVMKLQIKVSEAGVIEDAKFKTYGCGSVLHFLLLPFCSKKFLKVFHKLMPILQCCERRCPNVQFYS